MPLDNDGLPYGETVVNHAGEDFDVRITRTDRDARLYHVDFMQQSDNSVKGRYENENIPVKQNENDDTLVYFTGYFAQMRTQSTPVPSPVFP